MKEKLIFILFAISSIQISSGKQTDDIEIIGFTAIPAIEVPYGYVIENTSTIISLPSAVEVHLNNGTKQILPVKNWTRGYDETSEEPAGFYCSHTSGTYMIYGNVSLEGEPRISNPNELKIALPLKVKSYDGVRPEREKLKPSVDTSESPWDKGAGNPLVAGYFADPHMLVDSDTYYFYSSTDQYVKFFADNGPFGVWKSKDFINWEFKTFTYPDNFPTDDNWLWAPMAIKGPDGKFYLYYQRDITGTHVAVSDSPEGPWKAVRNAGLNNNLDAIETKASWNFKGMHDSDVFRDDDGKYYLIFNGPGMKGISSVIYIGELITDPNDENFMCGFVKAPSIVLTKDRKGEYSSEAASLFKKDGIYYLTYSELGGEYYNAVYRMSDNIYGPYGEDFFIVQPNTTRQLRGPGHGMIFTNTDGSIYFLHHRQGYSQNIMPYNPVNESGRQIGVERLTFNKNGTIQEIIPSYDGVKNLYMAPRLNWEENLSAGYKVTATASENSELAVLATDQNNATQWVANSLAGSEQWLCVDLGSVKEINRTEVFFEFPTRYYEYRLEYSKDGKKWKNYADNSSNRDRNSPKKDKKKVKARYMKLFVGNIENDPRIHDGKLVDDKVRACVFEFNIYGPGKDCYTTKFKINKDNVSLRFKGTGIKLYGKKSVNGAKAIVYIDGIIQSGQADFKINGIDVSNTLLYTSPKLHYGNHIIEIKGLVNADMLEIAEIINSGPTPRHTATIDDIVTEGKHRFTYYGDGWSIVTDSGAYNATLHRSSEQTDYVEFTFTGNQVELYGQIGAGSKAYISINGSPYEYYKARFDNSEIINQYKVYTSPVLPFGNHTIRITTRGDQNIMNLDYVKVYKTRNK